MNSDDLRTAAVTAAADPDQIAHAQRLEENGDAAREYGHLEFALLQYRRAAELRPLDARLAAKIADTAAGRFHKSTNERGWLPSLARRRRVAAYIAMSAVVMVAAAATVFVHGRRPAEEAAGVVAVNTSTAAVPPTLQPAVPSSPAPATSESPPSEEPAVVHEQPKAATVGSKRAPRAHLKTRRHVKHAPGRLVTAHIDAGCGGVDNPCQVEKVSRPTQETPHPAPRRMGLLQLIF